jgi:hypothetical protein
MAQELTAAERAQYQQAIRNTLGYTAPFGGGAYGQFVQTLNPNQRAIAEELERQYVTERTAYDQPVQQTSTAQPTPTIDYSALASQLLPFLPQIDYGQISGLMAPTQQAAQGTQAAIGTAAAGQAPTLFSGQAGLMSGQQALGTQVGEAQQLLQAGQMGLGAGQQALGEGQQALGAGQQALGAGQQALGEGQQALGTQVGGVQTGVTGLQQAVGQAADGDQKATGLYAGQSGLMASQQQLGEDIGRQIGGVKAGVSDFQRAVEAYQRGAQAQRADIQSAALTGREQLQRQIGDVGIQANRAAEQLTQARQAAATPMGASQLAVGAIPGGVQQQAAQFARSAPAPSQTAPLGPLGPMSVDPRDALIRQLISGYRGLLSPQQ